MLRLCRAFWSAVARYRRGWWVVVKCTWPYPSGYVCYNKRIRTYIDWSATREEAQRSCDEMNGVKR